MELIPLLQFNFFVEMAKGHIDQALGINAKMTQLSDARVESLKRINHANGASSIVFLRAEQEK